MKQLTVPVCAVALLLAGVLTASHVCARSSSLLQGKINGCWTLSSERESGGYLQIKQNGNSFIRLPKKGQGKIGNVKVVVQDVDFSAEFTDGAKTQYLGHLIGPTNKQGIILDNLTDYIHGQWNGQPVKCKR